MRVCSDHAQTLAPESTNGAHLHNTMHPVDISEVGEWLGLSSRTVYSLAEQGIVIRVARGRYDLKASIANYCAHLREVAAGRAPADGGELDLVKERARLAKAQADGHELRNAQARGDLLPRSQVVAAWQSIISRARSRLLALPSKAAPLAISASSVAEAQERLTEIVHECLAELAATCGAPASVDGGKANVGGGNGSYGGVDSAAEINGQRVGGPRASSQSGGER